MGKQSHAGEGDYESELVSGEEDPGEANRDQKRSKAVGHLAIMHLGLNL